MRDELCRRLGTDMDTLAAVLLAKLTEGKALDLESVRREQPLTPAAPRERSDRYERGERGDRPERPERGDRPERSGERRPMAAPSEGKARCRTALGARDGVQAKNLLGAILNEGGLSREAIGRIQIRETFSLIELPEENLDRLLTKLKDTRVAGKALRLRRYRED